MKIVDIRERSIPISRYLDRGIPSGGLTTSLVAVVTDVVRAGTPIIGYGFASVGRFAQGGLIRERFAPRLLKASEAALLNRDGTNFDPFRAWDVMMAGEKLGGHGERCVAVGALDMAIWDAAAKIVDVPLYQFICERQQRPPPPPRIAVYASGGYPYPHDDVARLSAEIRSFADLGFTHAKIKVGSADLGTDLRRIEAAAKQINGSNRLAVDAMNRYDAVSAEEAAAALCPLELWWFEDICDPHDFDTLASVAAHYDKPIAAGEALFSVQEARLLDRHGGLRTGKDILLFDPVHCYGLPGYLKIIDHFLAKDWPRAAFWPHGGHLFGLHLAAALGLGGAETTPAGFHPFCGVAGKIENGNAVLPEAPGVGFETHDDAWRAFRALV